MQFVDLPPELLLLISQKMTPATFSVAITSCPELWHLAHDNRSLIFFFLRRVPGIKIGLEDLTTAELIRIFRQRAAQSLLGVGALADRHVYSFDYSDIDPRKSAVSFQMEPAFSLVCRSCALVHFYNSDLEPQGVFDAITHTTSIPRANSEILKVAYSQYGGISVLHGPTASSQIVSAPEFTSQFASLKLDDRYTVSHLYRPGGKTSREFCSAFGHLEAPHDWQVGLRAVALGVARPGLLAVTWSCSKWADKKCEVWLYSSSSGINENKVINYGAYRVLSCYNLDPRSSFSERLVTDVDFTLVQVRPSTTHKLNFYRPGSGIAHGYSSFEINPPNGVLGLSEAKTDYKAAVFAADLENADYHMSIDKPFYGRHIKSSSCIHQYLAVGVVQQRYHDPAFPPASYLLVTEDIALIDDCDHQVNLNLADRLDDSWRIAARLVGYKEPNTNIAGIVAYSSEGTRIAVANWKEILIYPLNPTRLLQCIDMDYEDIGDRYYASFPLPWAPELGYTSGSAIHEVSPPYDKKRLPNGEPRYAVLFPAVIDAGAIIFHMAFEPGMEDVLWVLTEAGVERFWLGPGGTGRSSKSLLKPPRMEEEDSLATGWWK